MRSTCEPYSFDPHWGEGGHGRELVLAEFPNPAPPKPFIGFQTHAAANGVDFSRSAEFGFEGAAFVACSSDLVPITTIKKAAYSAGFNVVRVYMRNRRVEPFAVNEIKGPASKLLHDGFERPDNALYVVDLGIISFPPEAGGICQQIGSGALWRPRCFRKVNLADVLRAWKSTRI